MTGGTGFVGKPLVESLLSRGDSVTVLTRSIEKAQTIFPEKTPQFLTALSTLKDLNGFDAVINLAGEPIFDKRWTVQQKEKLLHSRIDLTQQIVQLINQSEHPPVLISGSATGIYGNCGEDRSLKALLQVVNLPHNFVLIGKMQPNKPTQESV